MKPGDLAHWYFRLNGFFTIVNFVLHPVRKGGQLTDADILGFRFPFRAEFSDVPDFDDREFRSLDLPILVCAEVTRGECKLNGPWTEPERENIHALLRALGPYAPSQIPDVASALYETGINSDDILVCSLFCIGNSVSDTVGRRYPKVPQKTWRELIAFIHGRFRTYRARKSDIEQWDEVGRNLWQMSLQYGDASQFENAVRRGFSLPA